MSQNSLDWLLSSSHQYDLEDTDGIESEKNDRRSRERSHDPAPAPAPAIAQEDTDEILRGLLNTVNTALFADVDPEPDIDTAADDAAFAAPAAVDPEPVIDTVGI
eukprot:gene825-2216_t